MNLFFRLFLSFNSTSLIIVVFLVKNGNTLNSIHPCLIGTPRFVSFAFYFLVTVFLTYISLIISKWLTNDSIESVPGKPAIIAIEQANNSFLPSYLGYFFVAVSIPNFETLFFVFILLFIFTFFSQTLYFNPLFLIFGYHFYYLTTQNQIRIFLITKERLNNPEHLSFPQLKRINDFTFIENEK
jgi:hypothetical protein